MASHGPDDDAFDPNEDSHREGWSGFVPEFLRKTVVAGLGALFMTEEGIRSLAGQLKLPKEMLGFVLAQAEKSKDEIGRVVSEELRRFLQSEKLREEFLKLVSSMTIEIKAEVRLKPKDAGQAQLVISELSTRRQRKGGKKE